MTEFTGEEADALLALDALLLADEPVGDPPPDLRAATLLRASSRRRPGRPVDAVMPCSPAVAFDRTVEDLRDLLASLGEADWEATAHPEHGRVRDLMAHLVGVERLVRRWLEPEDPDDPVPDLPDHVAATRPVVAEFAGADPYAIAQEWYAAARAVSEAAAGDGGRLVVFHDLRITVDQLLVTRTGELWAHAIDISRATGRPVPGLDMERMTMLCTALMEAVPLTLAYAGAAAPGRSARFVLTGPAGGTYTVPLAPQTEPPLDPEVTILADAVGLCRLAVRRLLPGELDATIEGDRELGDLVLERIGALARD